MAEINFDINYINAKKDILNFYHTHTICINKCNHYHDYYCLHHQLFELMKTVKPKYSDITIIHAFFELYNTGTIFIFEQKQMKLFIENNMIYDMLKYLDNDFWILSTFKKNIPNIITKENHNRVKFILNMESIFEDINDTSIFHITQSNKIS